MKAGIDYYLAEKSIISFSTGFNIRENNRNELLAINQFNSALNPLELSNRVNTNNGNGDSFDLNLDFTQKFKKPKEELTLNFGYSEGNNDNLQVYNTKIYNVNGTIVDPAATIQRNNSIGTNRNYNAQLDYTLPFGMCLRKRKAHTLRTFLKRFRGKRSLTHNFPITVRGIRVRD